MVLAPTDYHHEQVTLTVTLTLTPISPPTNTHYHHEQVRDKVRVKGYGARAMS